MRKLALLILIAFAFSTEIANGAILLVQTSSVNCGSVVNCTLAFPTSTHAGDFYILDSVLGAQNPGNGNTSASSTQGDTFQSAVFQNQATAGNSQILFYAMNVIGGTTSLTFHVSSTAKTVRMSIAEYSGVATTNALDTTNSTSGAAYPSTSQNITTSQAVELLIGGNSNGNNGATTTLASKNGFTNEAQVLCPISSCEAFQDRITTSTVTASSGYTAASGTNWTQLVAAFKAAVAASSKKVFSKPQVIADNW